MVRVRIGSVSITGNFRENNEDSVCIDSQSRYVIVADGMGGQSAGEKASAIAVELIPKKLEQLVDFDQEASDAVVERIDQAVEHANAEIMALGEVDAAYRNMGTTVVFLVQAGSTFIVGGVGDSRAYLCNDSALEQLTTDHSLTQALLDAGTITPEEAIHHKYRNVLYRYLGTKEGGTGTHARLLKPQSGHRYLLCSDGVTDGVNDDQLRDLLHNSDDAQETAAAIVEAAQAGGSKDNISCVVVIVE